MDTTDTFRQMTRKGDSAEIRQGLKDLKRTHALEMHARRVSPKFWPFVLQYWVLTGKKLLHPQ